MNAQSKARSWIGLILLCTGAMLSGAARDEASGRTLSVPFQAGNAGIIAIKDSMMAAMAGDVVVLDDGTWEPTSSAVFDTTGHSYGKAMIFMKSGVILTSEHGADSTALSGGGLGRVIFADDAESTTAVQDLTITKGSAVDPATFWSGWGGGIVCYHSPMVIQRCTFTADTANYSGAIEIDASDVRVTDCRVVSNVAIIESGGMAMNHASLPVLTGCTFDSNVALGNTGLSPGGALCVYGGAQVTMTDCTFTNNGAVFAGIGHWSGSVIAEHCTFEGNHSRGGGAGCVYAAPSGSGPICFVDCTFSGNGASDSLNDGLMPPANGGAVYVDLSQELSPADSVTFSGCVFEDNVSQAHVHGAGGLGGAVFVTGLSGATQRAALRACTFRGNESDVRGGAVAIAAHSGRVDVADGEFLDNTAGSDGGAVAVSSLLDTVAKSVILSSNVFARNSADATSGEGGALYLSGDAPRVSTCTLYDNAASSGGGIRFTQATVADTISNTIIAATASGSAVVCDSLLTLKCCDVWSNSPSNWTSCISGQSGSNGNFSRDPEFCSVADDDYHLRVNSPCHPDSSACGLIGALGPDCSASLPIIALSPSSIAFGSVPVRTVGVRSLEVRNVGGATLNVTSIAGGNDRFEVSPTSFSVVAGESTAVHLTFRPDSVKAEVDTLAVASNDPQYPVVHVVLSGTGSDSTSWSGNISLDGDVEVGAGSTLTVAAGTVVNVKAHYDHHNVGVDSTRTELIIHGRLVAAGSADSTIQFKSFGGSAEAGDWYGMRFHLTGCAPSGAYGYVGSLQPLSTVAHARIEDAQYGVVVEDLSPPNLEHLTFGQITGMRDIFLTSDVVIPQGYWGGGSCGSGSFYPSAGRWDLDGGTHVVASTSTFNDAWIGTSGKNDLIVYGKLFTDGSVSAGDSVFFGPDTVTDVADSTAARDWGGILLTSYAAGSHLRFADIGYAENPVFMSFPDSLTGIERSRIHHFADTGVWIEGTMGSGGYLDSCLVDRGSDLNPALGGTGIYLDQTDQLNLLDTNVWLKGRDDDNGATGIEVHFGKTFCVTSPPSSRALLLERNIVVGPGEDVPNAGTDYTGIQTDWVCGSNNRTISILRNVVAGFPFAGVDFEQTANVQFTCNVLWQNHRGVDVYRDSEPTGTSIRFKDNKLQAMESDSTFFALRTTDASKVKLGPYQSDRGHNRLKVNENGAKFIFENDSNASHVLDATYNYWYADTLLADSTQIASRLAPPGYSIDFSHFLIDDSSIPADCWLPTSVADSVLSSGSSARHGLVAASEPNALSAPAAEAPTVLELGKPFPNPNRAGAALSLSVPKDRVGRYSAEVFDVLGRRVWSSQQSLAAAGRYRVVWEGRDGSNREVASGVYFLRLSGPGGFVQTRKITLLR